MRTLGPHWIPFMVVFPLIKELIFGVWGDCSVDKVLSVQAISSWVQIQPHHEKLDTVHAPVTPELRNRNRWIYPWDWLFSQSSQKGELLSSARDCSAKNSGREMVEEVIPMSKPDFHMHGWGHLHPHRHHALPTQMFRNNRHTSS